MHRHFASCLLVLAGLSSPALSAPRDAPDQPPVDRDVIRKELLEQRKINLERFHEYRRAHIYPHNSYEPGMKNVWTDREGHLCAVATMMERAGEHALVVETGRDQNFVRLADVSSGPLIDWVLTSGFTHEEVVMIQQPSDEEVEAENREMRREERRLKRALAREDDRLAGNYLTIEKALKRSVMSDASLDLAVARLATRPDLVTALHAKSAH